MKFLVNQVPTTANKPHGLDYTLTMHSPDGACLASFDNAHPVANKTRMRPTITSTGCALSSLMSTAMPARWSIMVTPLATRLCRPSEAVLGILPSPQQGAFTKEGGQAVVDAKGQRVANS